MVLGEDYLSNANRIVYHSTAFQNIQLFLEKKEHLKKMFLVILIEKYYLLQDGEMIRLLGKKIKEIKIWFMQDILQNNKF